MRNIISIILCLLLSSTSILAQEPKSTKAKSSDVRLQDNGWIRIVDKYVSEVTAKEFYKNAPFFPPDHLPDDKIRRFHVKLMFLKPCKATTKWDEHCKEKGIELNDPDALVPLVGEKGECMKLIIRALQTKQNEASEEMIKECPDWMDYIYPRFQCDYRLKVFFASFTPSKFKEYEYFTSSYFPLAERTGSSEKLKFKDEMLPGETMWMEFHIPSDAKSWEVWVPK